MPYKGARMNAVEFRRVGEGANFFAFAFSYFINVLYPTLCVAEFSEDFFLIFWLQMAAAAENT